MRRAAHLAPRVGGVASSPPIRPDRGGHRATARVLPPQAATYAGKGPERAREGGRRGPPGLDAFSSISKERGARLPTRALGDPVGGEGLITDIEFPLGATEALITVLGRLIWDTAPSNME
eukprot:6172091-Pleurochrysis_carterae.AAC.2